VSILLASYLAELPSANGYSTGPLPVQETVIAVCSIEPAMLHEHRLDNHCN
jgi:hypothetical protein